jgi:hypothetical protein
MSSAIRFAQRVGAMRDTLHEGNSVGVMILNIVSATTSVGISDIERVCTLTLCMPCDRCGVS